MILPLAGALALLVATQALSGLEQPPQAEAGAVTFVGAARCATCHPAMHDKWSAARHSKMVQPATPASVQGDFARGSVSLRGKRYRFRVQGDRYFISESYLVGREQEHRVAYTLGNRRIQHYLTTQPDGRMVVLPPSWDIQRREWFHNLEIVDPEETDQTRVQVWNTNCFGCHVSQQEKNFDPEAKTYATRWMDFGTSCERCHGPGSRHAARYADRAVVGAGSRAAAQADTVAPDFGADPYAAPGASVTTGDMVRPTKLGHVKSTMICAQCHSLRDITAAGFVAGADYYDHFMPILEYAQKVDKDPAYWPDGRPRRFSNDALGLWQSECFLKGQASCTSCHLDPHEPDIEKNPQLAPANNALCLGCHEGIGKKLVEHTRHAATSPGSSCVECHMPKTVFSIKASMRDHAIGVPVPENTVRFGIPNACNTCHQDKSAAWAVEAMKKWYPSSARDSLVDRAAAFVGGRATDPAALDRLIALAGDASQGPLARANALGYLRRYPQPRVLPVLVSALQADHPLVRAVAALTLGELPTDVSSAKPALVQALGDPNRIVRMGAAFSLVNKGTTRLEGEDGRRLEAAKADYVARAALFRDDPETQMNLGKFFYLNGDAEKAAEAFRDTLGLEPRKPGATYLLALSLLRRQRVGESRELLKQVPPADPFFPNARDLLKKIDKKP